MASNELRKDDYVRVDAQIIEVGENSQGEVAYRVAFENGAHFWIDAEHVSSHISFNEAAKEGRE